MKKYAYKKVYYRVLSVVLVLCMMFSTSGFGLIQTQAATENVGDDGSLPTAPIVNMASDAAIDLATLSAGTELQSGAYYLSETKTFGSYNIANNGLKIAKDATVYIYVPTGITLTAIGGGVEKEVRRTGGYAGILLPNGSTLIILGEGEVVAKGGNAGSGANGGKDDNTKGGAGVIDLGSEYYGGRGGAGGAGGGGAGAGIGTNGGYGGYGGSKTSDGTRVTRGDKDHYSGTASNSGGQGGTADAMGNLYVQSSIILTTEGGLRGDNGGAGTSGSTVRKEGEWNEKTHHVAGGGGGGGGGGAGDFAYGIGTGGPAGGGGGSGGQGGIDFSTSAYTSSNNTTCNGGDGYGGYGYMNGTTRTYGASGGRERDSGGITVDGKMKWDKEGASGGARGTAGTASKDKSASVLYAGWADKTYTVTFKGETGETISQMNYVYGTESSITVPEYTPTEGKCFLGWEVSVYGATPDPSAKLTSTSESTDTAVYQPGQTISIELGVSGSIELIPILGTLSGTSAQTEVLTIPAAEIEQAVTYYTYTVETTLDGVATDMGNLTLVDGEGKTYTISCENNNYTYITSKNETYRILKNGEDLGVTVSAGETTVIPYKSLSITTKLNGSGSLRPGDVTISGTDAPGISVDKESGIYTAVDLASNTTEYRIFVAGKDTGETISIGERKTFDYYSTTVNIGGNTVAESVALRENSGGRTYLLTETASNEFVLIEPAIEGTYTLYVNGFKTEYTAIRLSQENTFAINLFTTIITTTLNGELADIDGVTVGEQQAIYESTGKYKVLSVMTGDAPTADIIISDRIVGAVTIGTEKEIPYYSVEYTHGSKEANILPVDDHVYLENDYVTVMSSVTPKNNAYTFEGWNVLDQVKQSGDTFRMPAAKVDISADWGETVYNISYELEEPNAVNATANPETYSISDTFTLNNPTLEGYIFDGWTYGEVIVPTKDVTIPQGTTGELIFVANWILKTYEISADRTSINFGSRIDGYSGAAMQEIVGITSIGNQAITLNELVCDSEDFIITDSNMDYSLEGNGGYTEFIVQPKDNLGDGIYTGTITVSTVEGNTLEIALQFEVGMDRTPPVASIVVGENTWDDIIFEPENIYYYNNLQAVTINATDSEKGVAQTEYYISAQPLVWSDDEEDWTEADGTLINWNVYDNSAKPVITDEGIYYIYAKVTDAETPANITDISTDTILIDKTAPTAEFINDTEVLIHDGVFEGKKQVTVRDERLETVSLNGTACEVLEDGTCTFVVNPNENVVQTIVATDKAGNVTTIDFIVNPRKYNITYDLNGLTGTIEPEIAKEQIPYTVSDGSEIIPERGMRLAHWAVGAVDSTTTIEVGGTFVFEDHTTLYAIWDYATYDITYNLDGGTNASTNPITYTMVTEDIVLSEPSRDGYIFTGWTWEATEGVGDAEQTTPVKEVTLPTNGVGNKVFTANWIAKDYTITSDVEVGGIAFNAKLEYVYASESVNVSISNAGNWVVNLKTPASDAENSAFVIGQYSNTSLEPGETATFSISTKERLDVGTYTEMITVETIEGTSVVIPVSFIVTEDDNAPTALISIKENRWTEFLNTITFGIFFKETEDVTIVAEDLVNGADVNTGVDKIYYYLSETQMSKQDLENLPTDEWEEYQAKFSIDPNCKLIVYAKIVDHGENETYISSDGIIFDAKAPMLLGVKDGKSYCADQSFTVKDDNLEEVTVNGTVVTLTNNSYELVGDGTEYTIVATDKAGNVTTVRVMVYGNDAHDLGEPTCVEKAKCQREGCAHESGEPLGHSWTGEWTVVKEATATEEGIKETLCTRQCGHKKAVMIPAIGDTEDVVNLEKSMEIDNVAPIEKATLDNDKSELIEAEKLFTDAEITEIENGAAAKVWVEISKTDEESITAGEQTKVEEEAAKVMGDNFRITYFDADLFKQIGAGEKTPVTEPGVAIKITITIPDKLINQNKSVHREYKIIRIHEGVVDVISGVFNEETNEFSFESNKFSTYAIIYRDVSLDDKNDDDAAGKDESNKNDELPGGNNIIIPGGGNDSIIPGGGNNDNAAEDGKNDDGTEADDKKDDGIKENGKKEDKDKADDKNDDKNDDIVDGNDDTNGNDTESNTGSADETDVVESEIVEDVPKAEAEKLSNAVKEILNLVPSVKEGPYIYIPNVLIDPNNPNASTDPTNPDITEDGAQVQIRLELPEYLNAEGRNFYLITVDEEGNIVVILAEVTEDGVLVFEGNPNATYQLVYEEGEALLASMISEGGYLVNANGDVITVSETHCFWHYMILVLAAIGTAVLFFFKENRKNQWLVLGIDAVLMILLTVTGNCNWDMCFTIFGIVLMLVVILGKKDSNELVRK